jgi:hypothetical protein
MCFDETGRTPSRFPEFVYGWFSQFEINSKTRQVMVSEDWWRTEAVDRSRLNLLLALKSEKSRKSWEVVTFTEFLQEDLMLDELRFYLHCRALLFQGPQLKVSTGRFSALHYVSFVRVCEVIDRVMYKISSEERSQLKDQLQEKTRSKKNKITVEASLALRVMLEYYRREKKCRVILIKQLFEAAPKRDGVVGFHSFREICLNINHDLSETDLARFYRECWVLGHGRMDAHIFLLLANESPFFFRALRLRGEWDTPPINEHAQIDPTAGEYAQRMADGFRDFKRMSRSKLGLLKDTFTMMGCSEVMHHLKLLEESLNRKCQGNPEDYNGRSFTDLYKALWRLLVEMKLAYQQFNVSHIDYENDYLDIRKSCKAFIDKIMEANLNKIATDQAIQLIRENWRGRSLATVGRTSQSRRSVH